MKNKVYATQEQSNILANDHFVAVSYDCSEITPDENGVIKAGTIIPANDATAVGVLLNDVYPDDDPNGAIVVHGFISKANLPEQPAETVAIKQVTFI
jgi:hypothetical protein